MADSEKQLDESKKWGAVYLSQDNTYAEYAVAPQSMLAMQVSNLMALTQSPSPFWPKSNETFWSFTSYLVGVILILVSLGEFTEKILVLDKVCWMAFLPMMAITVIFAVFVRIDLKNRHIPQENIHFVKIHRYEYIDNDRDDVVT